METNISNQSRPRGIYLLPNLLTTSGLFAGFFAIVMSMKGHFASASLAIFISMLMDALDGRLARITHTQSAFGVQYDSLADMVSFGVAPSLLAYSWALFKLGNLGWLAAFLFTAASALRLARFNTQAKTDNKNNFQGMSTTASAGILTSFIWTISNYWQPNIIVCALISIITIVLAVLMISNIRYRSFKEIDFKGRIPFIRLATIVLIFVAVSINPPVVLLICFSIYGISGPLTTLLRLRRAKLSRKKKRKRNRH